MTIVEEGVSSVYANPGTRGSIAEYRPRYGHYIGGEHEGKTGASRTIVVVCADSTWKLASSTEEPPQ